MGEYIGLIIIISLFAILILLLIAGTKHLTQCEVDKPRQTNYEDLLKTEEWINKRKEILQLHNYKCDWCGSKKHLQVHHKKYLKYPNGEMVTPWNYDNKDLMCLCDNCHKKYHQKYKVKTYYRRY